MMLTIILVLNARLEFRRFRFRFQIPIKGMQSVWRFLNEKKSLVQRFKKWYLYLYFLIEENLGEWKMRNMMTVTMRIPERLQSLLC